MRAPWTRRDFVKLLGAVTGVAAVPAAAVARIATQAEKEDPKLHPLVRVVLAIKARGKSHESNIKTMKGLCFADDGPGVVAILRHPEAREFFKAEMIWLSGEILGPNGHAAKVRLGLIPA